METGFAAVWRRVNGADPAIDERAKLRRWILNEDLSIRQHESLLSLRMAAQVRGALQQMLLEKRRQLKKLQTMFCLRTGDTIVPKPDPVPPVTSLLKGLRDLYASALASAKNYENAVAEDKELAALCVSLAEAELDRASRLRELAERLL